MKKISVILTCICAFASISIFTSTIKASTAKEKKFSQHNGKVIFVDAVSNRMVIEVDGFKKNFIIANKNAIIKVNNCIEKISNIKPFMNVSFSTEATSNIIHKILANDKKSN